MRGKLPVCRRPEAATDWTLLAQGAHPSRGAAAKPVRTQAGLVHVTILDPTGRPRLPPWSPGAKAKSTRRCWPVQRTVLYTLRRWR
jgi:hypothetical protein